jgi:hypothetical protein
LIRVSFMSIYQINSELNHLIFWFFGWIRFNYQISDHLEVVWFKVQVWVKTLKGVCYVCQLKVRVILGQFSVLSVFLLSLLSLAFVLGSDIKKMQRVIRSKQSQIRILLQNFILSSFTQLNITPNPIVGLSWNLTWRSRTYWSMLGKVSGESEFGKDLRYRSEHAIRILLLISFWLVDFLFGKDPFPTRMWEFLLGIF